MQLNPDAQKQFRIQEYDKRDPIEGIEIVSLKRFGDDGGSMVELARLSDGEMAELPGFKPAQINYSAVQPGVVKAFHVHRRQTDVWFVRPEDRLLLVLLDLRLGSPTENRRMRWLLGDGSASLVKIPPGVAHGCRNVGRREAGIVYLTDLQFSPEPEKTDEGRLPWDYAGSEIWDVAWE